MTGRHARQAGGRRPVKRAPLVGAIVACLLFAGVAGFWFTPAAWVPGTVTRSCTVTGGGTLRLHTSDCGTLYVRGRVSLMAGQHVTATMTGPVAWHVEAQS